MTPKPAQPRLAIAFMLCATAFIAATMLLAKTVTTPALGPPLHPLQASHGRFLFAFLAIATAVAAVRPKLSHPRWRLHFGRTIFGWAGVTLMFAAVAYIPLSDATAISFLNPVFGMLLAIPLLGERVGRWRWLAAVLAIVGSMILLRPSAQSFEFAGLLALGSAAFLGMELIFIKKLADREPAFQILLTNNALGLVIATLAVIPVWSQPTGQQWLALAGLGLMMAAAQACFVNAMARADASLVTPFSYITLVFVSIYDFAVFQSVPDHISILGAVTILTGATLLAWRENRKVSC